MWHTVPAVCRPEGRVKQPASGSIQLLRIEETGTWE